MFYQIVKIFKKELIFDISRENVSLKADARKKLIGLRK